MRQNATWSNQYKYHRVRATEYRTEVEDKGQAMGMLV